MRILNRTPEVNTMLCFANLAVHANDNYQVIFPPSTQFGVLPRQARIHGLADFPFRLRRRGFPKGVDISWYKNHISAQFGLRLELPGRLLRRL